MPKPIFECCGNGDGVKSFVSDVSTYLLFIKKSTSTATTTSTAMAIPITSGVENKDGVVVVVGVAAMYVVASVVTSDVVVCGI